MEQTLTIANDTLARSIVEVLQKKGFIALYAGGCVRDALLNISPPGDIDIATNAVPRTIAQLFPHVVGVGEHFGVMLVITDGVPFEVATFRTDIGVLDGRHPEKVSFGSAEMDAQRRDFTVNGLFLDPSNGKILDYIEGKKDLERKIIRAIGDPNRRFEEDYLRLLRAIRFSAGLSFTIEEQTWNAILANAKGIKNISQERIFQEVEKMLVGKNPHIAIELLDKSGLLHEVLPEIEQLKGVEQPPEFHPEGDVFQHTLLALSLLENPTPISAWSTLLHDVGKPKTMSFSDRIRFNNHHKAGASIAKKILRRLKASRQLVDDVSACIDNHMNFMNVQNMRL